MLGETEIVGIEFTETITEEVSLQPFARSVPTREYVAEEVGKASGLIIVVLLNPEEGIHKYPYEPLPPATTPLNEAVSPEQIVAGLPAFTEGGN